MPQAVPVCRWEPSLRGERIGNASKKTSRSIRDKEREVLLHKILGVAHFVAQKAAKVAQNTPFLCSTAYRKLLICIRWEYYLANFKTAAFSQLGHSSVLHCTLNPFIWFLARIFASC
jgi:hypothetical protein